jgi:hypothetical protein
LSSSQAPKQSSQHMGALQHILTSLPAGSNNLTFQLEVTRKKLQDTRQQVAQVCMRSCCWTG